MSSDQRQVCHPVLLLLSKSTHLTRSDRSPSGGLELPRRGEAPQTTSLLDSSRTRNRQYGRAFRANEAVGHVIRSGEQVSRWVWICVTQAGTLACAVSLSSTRRDAQPRVAVPPVHYLVRSSLCYLR